MHETTPDDRPLHENPPPEEIYCLTFVKGMSEAEVLSRMGAVEGTEPRTPDDAFAERESFDAGYPEIVRVLSVGEWSVVHEPFGFTGADTYLLAALSEGTEAVSLLRHEYASHCFSYAVDGVVLCSFDPLFAYYRWGADPDVLVERMRAVGLYPDRDELDLSDWDFASALALVETITGSMPTMAALQEALPSAEVEPWFSAATGGATRPLDRQDTEHAVQAATPELCRAVAVAEFRRLARDAGIAEQPGLQEALTRAERAEPVTVSRDSDLGRAVRTWRTDSRRAGRSLNDHRADRTTEHEREAAFRKGWVADALRHVLDRDPREAAYGVLYPLVMGPPPLQDSDRLDTVLSVLRSEKPPQVL